MCIFIGLYIFYAFVKVKNYLIQVYIQSMETLEASQEVIANRVIEMENVQTVYGLVKVILKYGTLDILLNVWGIFFGGYIIFYFIALFVVEVLLTNKKGQTIGKRCTNLRTTRNKRWWEHCLRSLIIHFGQMLVLLGYLYPFRRRRGMVHELLFKNYVIFNYNHEDEKKGGDVM